MDTGILVVARSLTTFTLYPQILKAAGYRTHWATSLIQAQDIAREMDISLVMVAPTAFGPTGQRLADELGAAIGRLIVLAERDAELVELRGRYPKALAVLPGTVVRSDVLAAVEKALSERAGDGVGEFAEPEVINLGPVTFHPWRRSVALTGRAEIHLTEQEFKLLGALVRSPERVLSRDHLAECVYGSRRDAPPRGIDNLVSRLRKKIEVEPRHPVVIVSAINGGYRLAVRPISAPTSTSSASIQEPAVKPRTLEAPITEPAHAPSTANDEPIPDAAIAEIGKVVGDIKAQLPALRLSNSGRAEINSDIAHIEVEIERPAPRRRFMKLYLESLRDNLAKAAGAATAGGITALVALAAGLLAKYFGVL